MENSTLKILVASVAIVAGAGVTTAYAQDRGDHGPAPTFEELDVDGSGEITAEDLEALRANRFGEIDANGDGSVSEAEFMAHATARAEERAAGMFARLDADGDGQLSRDVLESRQGRGMGQRLLTRFDADNSGGVSAEEFETAKELLAERRGGGKHRDGRGNQ